jgi:hypothetical protein
MKNVLFYGLFLFLLIITVKISYFIYIYRCLYYGINPIGNNMLLIIIIYYLDSNFLKIIFFL